MDAARAMARVFGGGGGGGQRRCDPGRRRPTRVNREESSNIIIIVVVLVAVLKALCRVTSRKERRIGERYGKGFKLLLLLFEEKSNQPGD